MLERKETKPQQQQKINLCQLHNTVTNMKFKYGITLLCYTAIMLPAHMRWIDTGTPTLR